MDIDAEIGKLISQDVRRTFPDHLAFKFSSMYGNTIEHANSKARNLVQYIEGIQLLEFCCGLLPRDELCVRYHHLSHERRGMEIQTLKC